MLGTIKLWQTDTEVKTARDNFWSLEVTMGPFL
jgi:hypothetical protein